MKLILASASPRRAQILRDAGISFETCVVQVDESCFPNESAEAMVARLAEAKARAAAELYDVPAMSRATTAEPILIIGADTCVELHGDIFGKPRDAAHARDMLLALSGRTHRVLTGIAVLRVSAVAGPPAVAGFSEKSSEKISEKIPEHTMRAAVETTLVSFAPLMRSEIDAYVATGEPLDKAGAYAIQGGAGCYIPRIEGCYFNVVGLPLARLCDLLRSLGWQDESLPGPDSSSTGR